MSQYLWDDILIVGDSFCADRKCGVSIRDDLIQYRSKKELSNHFDLEKNYRLAEKLFRILEKYPGDFTQFDERLL